jgi:VIT1/CCC1 family predicted Fe2+/Mn2+ transporter
MTTERASSSTGQTPSSVGHQHADVTGGWLRPAVFGAMDGLVSNFALIAGVAGGSDDRQVIILAGLAGLAAGAFSMAAGEYTSVAAQAELAEAEISLEREELRTNPDAEEQELADMYVAKGLEPELAKEVARQLHLDPDRALDVHTREELGVTLGDLPSPRLAAVSSFVAFAIGALVPVVPYLLGALTLLPAVVVALVGLFLTGAAVTRLTSRPWWYGGIRQLVLGSAAAALTYAFGNLVGAGLG